MNLDPLSSGDADAPLAPTDWSMDVVPDGGGFVAIVKRSNAVMCRIMLAGTVHRPLAARSALAGKARAWIADYLSRSHGGDTDFAPLDDSA